MQQAVAICRNFVAAKGKESVRERKREGGGERERERGGGSRERSKVSLSEPQLLA